MTQDVFVDLSYPHQPRLAVKVTIAGEVVSDLEGWLDGATPAALAAATKMLPQGASTCGIVEARQRLREAANIALERAERESMVIAEVVVRDPGAEVRVYFEATGRSVPRRTYEGGTIHGSPAYVRQTAASEAEERALRAAGGKEERIIRRGYDRADVA